LYGFEPVDCSVLSFDEQVEIFRSAEYIVGPSGAAFANSLFCPGEAKVLSWLPVGYEDFSVYSTIAKISGAGMHFLRSIPIGGKIENSFDVYEASYYLDPREFTEALVGLTKR
jgi:hypothetical protein